MTDAEKEAGEIVREIMDTLRDPMKTMDPVQFRSRILRFAREYGPEIWRDGDPERLRRKRHRKGQRGKGRWFERAMWQMWQRNETFVRGRSPLADWAVNAGLLDPEAQFTHIRGTLEGTEERWRPRLIGVDWGREPSRAGVAHVKCGP